MEIARETRVFVYIHMYICVYVCMYVLVTLEDTETRRPKEIEGMFTRTEIEKRPLSLRFFLPL